MAYRHKGYINGLPMLSPFLDDTQNISNPQFTTWHGYSMIHY